MVKFDFQFDTKYGVYSDAIVLPDDHTFSDADIEAMKQERLNNWLFIVENPPQPTEVVEPIDPVAPVEGE